MSEQPTSTEDSGSPIIGESPSVVIDPEFRGLIPPLTDEQRDGLESSISAEGCRDALSVWGDERILIDGHNRHEICTRLGIQYQVHAVELADRGEAVNWIINNQLGRRNLTPEQQSYLRGKRYNREKGEGHRPRKLDQNDRVKAMGSTDQRLANELQVGSATIRRDGKFSAAVDKLAEAHGPELKQQILQRDSGFTKKAVVAAAQEEDPDKQKALLTSPLKRSGGGGRMDSQSKESTAKEVRGGRVKKVRDAAKRLAELVGEPVNQWSPIEIKQCLKLIQENAL